MSGRKMHSDESGHTIVESVVALTLLVIVLAPASALVVRQALDSSARDVTHVLAIARASVEGMLNGENASDTPTVTGKWKVVTTVKSNGTRIIYTATVFKNGDRQSNPLLTFSTVRYRPTLRD